IQMAISQRWTVIGIFNEQDRAQKALEELLQAEFTQEQVGYVMRDTPHVVSKKAVEVGEESGSFTGGIIGGIMGAAETLLIPVLGPSVANTIPATVEPLAEQVVERFQHTGIEEQQDHILPVTDDGIPEQPIGNDSVTENRAEATETTEITETTEAFDPDETIKMAAITSTTNTADNIGQDEMVTPDKVQNEEALPSDASQTQDAETVPADISRQREDEATGAVTGGIVGGVIGVAAGLLLPFIGPAIAGGAVIAALGGAALGAVAGSFFGVFVSMGVPEEQARQYEQEFKAGRTIVTVKTDDRQQDALAILNSNGAIYANAHDRAL
ncbi:MAG TPA: hypothetical protein VKU38_16440, partial [Ktedonobacteraceae bacterium]|nr:hypothetical protein [Ktedonobacteraceae bacterium]